MTFLLFTRIHVGPLTRVCDADEDFDDFLGQYAFPLAELRPGVRRVPVLDAKGEQ